MLSGEEEESAVLAIVPEPYTDPYLEGEGLDWLRRLAVRIAGVGDRGFGGRLAIAVRIAEFLTVARAVAVRILRRQYATPKRGPTPPGDLFFYRPAERISRSAVGGVMTIVATKLAAIRELLDPPRTGVGRRHKKCTHRHQQN